jgi:hypothetical protein
MRLKQFFKLLKFNLPDLLLLTYFNLALFTTTNHFRKMQNPNLKLELEMSICSVIFVANGSLLDCFRQF